MAQVEGVNVAALEAGTITIGKGKINTSLKVFSDTYELNSTVSTTTLHMATLPDGAVVHEVFLAFDDLGTGTVHVGDSHDPDRYKASVDVGAAAGSNAGVRVDGLGYVIGTNDGDNEILVTCATGTLTGTIKLAVFYA